MSRWRCGLPSQNRARENIGFLQMQVQMQAALLTIDADIARFQQHVTRRVPCFGPAVYRQSVQPRVLRSSTGNRTKPLSCRTGAVLIFLMPTLQQFNTISSTTSSRFFLLSHGGDRSAMWHSLSGKYVQQEAAPASFACSYLMQEISFWVKDG